MPLNTELRSANLVPTAPKHPVSQPPTVPEPRAMHGHRLLSNGKHGPPASCLASTHPYVNVIKGEHHPRHIRKCLPLRDEATNLIMVPSSDRLTIRTAKNQIHADAEQLAINTYAPNPLLGTPHPPIASEE